MGSVAYQRIVRHWELGQCAQVSTEAPHAAARVLPVSKPSGTHEA